MAVAIGPQGMAYVGQFQNTTSLFAMIGLAAINAGVIKYLAEYSDDSVKQQKVITTAFTVVITASLLTTFIVIAFSEQLSQAVFHSADFRIIFLSINVFFLKKLNFSFLPNFKKWDKKIVRLFFGFSIMTIVSGSLSPLVQIFIRDYIIQNDSLRNAGLWQAVTKISDYYLSFITTVLAVYYLPRLSELRFNHELRKEIANGYKVILPVVCLLALIIFFAKGLIIQILFTPEFEPMKPLFTFLMLSKAMTKMFIITEIGFSVFYLLLSYLFMHKYGVIGATYAFALNYAIYWVVMWFLLKNKLSKN